MKQNNIIKQQIHGVSFQAKEKVDLSFLEKFGQIFCVFDQNDSGNISFGVINEQGEKFFVKVAGVKTVENFRSPQEAVHALKQTVALYEDLRCHLLIDMVTSGAIQNFFYLIFHWAEGECLFDHWNFDYYLKHPEVDSPRVKFSKLAQKEKMKVATQLLEFMSFVETKNYGAVDFYDGSLMYDFETHSLTICDIDFFKKRPFVNNVGENYWGTKRLKAPEEYQFEAMIDERTAVFTIGALFFNIFGEYPPEILTEMYKENRFIPVSKNNWTLPEELYNVALKAVSKSPNDRYQTIASFQDKWLRVCEHLEI